MNRIRIGFIGAGGIARLMARTISEMPEVESYAVAARDLGRAEAFAREHGFLKSYGSYEELVSDGGVELVYIATPHSHHFDHAMMCLNHGKPVLCEKAFTANAPLARRLLDYAKEKQILVTEAIWTRYMPSVKMIHDLLDSGVIGAPTFLTANLGYAVSHNQRITDPALAGGALLDVGLYPVNFASMVFGGEVEKVSAEAVMFDTGVDAMNNITMRFSGGRTAFLYSTVLSQTDREGVIYGDKGSLIVDNVNNPERIHVISLGYKETACYDVPKQITGYEYQVRSVIKALSENRIECPEMPHSETIRIMEILDGIRASWGMRYPFEV